MKKRLCSLALALCLALSLVPGAAAAGYNPFWDVPASHWAHSAVTYVYEKGLMQGTSSIYFSPGGTTTRAQVVTVLYRLAGQPLRGRARLGLVPRRGHLGLGERRHRRRLRLPL